LLPQNSSEILIAAHCSPARNNSFALSVLLVGRKRSPVDTLPAQPPERASDPEKILPVTLCGFQRQLTLLAN